MDKIIKENYRMFNKTIEDIEFKMLRNMDNCWIKVEPIKRRSRLSSLHIILNHFEHNFEIYDENGLEAHKIYFKGSKIDPSFYLKLGEKSFKVDCKLNDIKIIPIIKTHDMKDYIEKNCSFTSFDASCWAVAVYYTSRPEKPPFDEM